MLYLVNEGRDKRWPDGTLRAESGVVFDGLDDIEPKAARELACSLLAPHIGVSRVSAEYDGPVVYEMPLGVQSALMNLGWVPNDKWRAYFTVLASAEVDEGDQPAAAPKPARKKKAQVEAPVIPEENGTD